MTLALNAAPLERVARSWRAYLIVALIALCSSVAGIARMPVMDVDEGRFVQASRQMLETGDFINIRLQDRERNRKPVGVHWLQTASTAVLSPLAGQQNAIWTYRIPSVLGAILAALATLWAGRALFGPRIALLGAGLLAAGVLLGFEGMTAKTDALMLGFTTLTMAALANLRARALGFAPTASKQRMRVLALVFWAAFACAILIKGPIAIGVVSLTIFALALWERKIAWLAQLAWPPGPLLALLIILPWAIAIGLATEWRFYTAAFTQDMAPKVMGQDHAHGGVFGYHTALLPLLLFPATFALPAAVRMMFRRGAEPMEAAGLRFVMAWALPVLALLELSPGKLVHYALPIYPAVALLCAAGLETALKLRWRVMLSLGSVLFVAAAAALASVMWLGARELSEDWAAAMIPLAIAASIALIGVAGVVIAKQEFVRAGFAVVCGLALSFALREAIAPNATDLHTSAALAAAARALDDGHTLWSVGYDEPSLVFLTRTSTRLASAEAAGSRAQAGDVMLLERGQAPAVTQALAARGLTFQTRAAPVQGISMSSGDQVVVAVGVVAPSSSEP